MTTEDFPKMLDIRTACRICLTEDGEMVTFIYGDSLFEELLNMLELCMSVQLTESETLSMTCTPCWLKLQDFFKFRQTCVDSDAVIRATLSELHCDTKSKNDSKLQDTFDDTKNIVHNCDDDSLTSTENLVNPEIYLCPKCEENFASKASFKAHFESMHALEEIVENKYKIRHTTVGKKFECNQCDKLYTSPMNLRLHMYSHTGMKPFSCEFCGKGFIKLISLKSHVAIHKGDRSHICGNCGKGFTSTMSLNRHQKTHSGIRPHKCSVCAKSFGASGDLKVHMRCHTGVKPYLCSNCGKTFARVTHLHIHMRIHTGERPYKCSLCAAAFAQTGDLRSHERIHTGEKPFQCKICNKRFMQSSGLSTHLRIHSSVKPFICSVCNKCFSQSSSLARHARCHTVQLTRN